jgi:hypothetical protein
MAQKFTFPKSFTRNRLSNYRSYRYYFALVVCDSAVTAEAISQQTNLDVWEHQVDENKLTKYGVKTIQVSSRGNSASRGSSDTVFGKYIVLINGSTDADFVITELKYGSMTAANAVPGDFGTSIAVEGTLKVSEPKGILFLDTITRAISVLNIDPSQAVYVLKPFFVGFRDDNNFSNEPINDLKPLMFIPYDISAVYTPEGGVYDMGFVAISNGVSRFPQYSQFEGISLACRGTLPEVMKQLEDKLNYDYQNIYQSLVDKFKKVEETEGIKGQVNYEKVEYKIIVDPYYHINAKKYQPTDTLQQYKEGGCDCTCIIKNTQGGSVETMIRQILEKTPQIKNDKIDKDNTGVKIEYKIMSTVRRILASEPYTQIVYVVKRFVTPQTGLLDFVIKNQNNQNFDPTLLERNVVEFDYLYTGMNTDVLNFDIKVNMGLAYLQLASSANLFRQQGEELQPKRFQIVDIAPRNVGLKKTHKVVVYPGLRPNNLVNNTTTSNATVGSVYTMAKHASLESSEAKITIRGNTAFLEAGNKLGDPSGPLSFVVGDTIYKVKTDPTTGAVITPLTIGDFDVASEKPTIAKQQTIPDMGDYPCFAKINVLMPSSADDLEAFRTGSDYSRNFWYEGYYYIFAIDHEFVDGQFTQTLDMVAVPNPETFENLTQKKKKLNEIYNEPTVVQQDEKQLSSFEQTNNLQIVVPFDSGLSQGEKPNVGAAPTNIVDSKALLVNNAINGVQSVKNWQQASPVVQNAIVSVPTRKVSGGVIDSTLLALLAYKLSNYNPSFAGLRGAGLYAWNPQKWLTYVKSNFQKFPTIVVKGKPSAKIIEDRFEASKATFVTSQYINDLKSLNITQPGDIYMTFLLAQIYPNEAERHVNRIVGITNANDGKNFMLTSIGIDPEKIYQIAGNARTYNNVGVKTVEDLRVFCYMEMAGSLEKGIPVATEKRQTVTEPRQTNVQASRNNTAVTRVNQNENTNINTSSSSCGPAAGLNPKAQQKTAEDSIKEARDTLPRKKPIKCGEDQVLSDKTDNTTRVDAQIPQVSTTPQ